jgi:hypothetical protein
VREICVDEKRTRPGARLDYWTKSSELLSTVVNLNGRKRLSRPDPKGKVVG